MFVRGSLSATAVAALVCAASANTTIIDRTRGLLTGTLTPDSTTFVARSATGGYQVTFTGLNSVLAMPFPSGTSWANYTHIDLRLRNLGVRPAMIEMDVSSANGRGWMVSKIVLAPSEALNVSVPLSITNALGMRVLPSMTDAIRAQTTSAGSIYPTQIGTFYLFNKDTQRSQIVVESMDLAVHQTPSTALVDTFGQQAQIGWKGKVYQVSDLTATRSESVTDNYAYGADSYGGVSGGKNYGTGSSFRTVKDNGKWYLVTPSGNRFFSLGVNEVGAQAWTPTQGRENLFADLPNLKASFPDAWSVRNGFLGFVPYQTNLERKYGASWQTTCEDLFTKRLKSWGFNTLGANCWDPMVKAQRIASTFNGWVDGSYRTFSTYDGRKMPDVFDPTYPTCASATLSKRLTDTGGNNDKNVGIFVDNEMPWGIRDNADVHYRYGLAVGALNAPTTGAHAELIAELKAKYATITALNSAWGTGYTSWAVFESGYATVPSAATPGMTADFTNFGSVFATKYFTTIRATLKSLNFRGLYLGCRFSDNEYVPEVLNAAMQSCDVLSFNIYSAAPSVTNADLKSLDFPIIISEFCFGASDMGRVGMPLFPTQTETARVDAVKRYLAEIKTWPNVVGAHWYRWEDFPSTGKIDGDNMSEGLISITDNPYSGLVNQFKSSSIDIMANLKLLP